jgi:hemerythrin superfamily protein
MTAIDLLTNDHREVSTMIDQLEGGVEGAAVNSTRLALFNRIKSALQLHSQLEEQFFYPALKDADETREIVQESYEEHQTVDELLAEISSTSPDDAEFMDLVAELRDNLTHHIEEEENELFPKANKVLGSSRLAEIGRQMEEMKKSGSSAAKNASL